MAQAAALARPFDQPGNVGHHELVLVEADHAQVRLEGGEGVVGDLGLGRRDPRDQGALAGVREPHQGHVGHQLELEVQPALLAQLGLLGERRGPAAVREEPGVAPAALPAAGRQPPVALGDQVGEHLAAGVCGRRCPRERAPPGRIRPCRGGPCPSRACRCRPAGGDGPESRRGTPRCGRPPARRCRRCRRRRRRGRPWRRGPPGETRPPRLRRHPP